MSARGFFLVVLIASRPSTTYHTIAEVPADSCPTNARVNLAGEVPDVFGTVKKFGHVFPPESIRRKDGEIFGCLCFDKPCLPLCCPLEMVRVNGVCVTDDNTRPATFPPIYSTNMTVEEVEVNPQNFNIVASDPCNSTDGGYLLEPETNPDEEFYLVKTGSMYLPKSPDHAVYNIGEYCLWRFENSSIYSPKVCFDEKLTPQTSHTVINAVMIASIVFLLVTLIVYTVLPETRNLHGLTLGGYVGCLFVAYAAMAVVMQSPSLKELPCISSAYVSLFSFLASFFWLNVTCFHIWQTFRRSRSRQENGEKSGWNRGLIYAFYSWGCAGFYTALYVSNDYLPANPDRLNRPKFAGVRGCWFRNDVVAQTFYFYGPMCVTVICNGFFLVSTAVKRNRDSKDAVLRLLRGTAETERRRDDKQWLNLCLKLFVAMVINWSMEVIWWFHQSKKYLRSAADFVHASHGAVVFIVLICRWNTILLIINRLGYQASDCRSSTPQST